MSNEINEQQRQRREEMFFKSTKSDVVDYAVELEESIESYVSRIQRKDALLRECSESMYHYEDCILQHCQAGEPTENGYRMMYKNKWYEKRPNDDTPKCDCGVDDLVARIKEETKE